MFVLHAMRGYVHAGFYTGRADVRWIGKGREAFRYETREGAERAAERHNKFTPVHGLHFTVEPAYFGDNFPR